MDLVDLFLEEYLLLSEITVPSIKNATISYLVWKPASIIYYTRTGSGLDCSKKEFVLSELVLWSNEAMLEIVCI